MYVECHFDNSPENQPIVDGQRLPVRGVYWGGRTADEMCLGNVLSVRVNPTARAAVDDDDDSDDD